MTRTRGETAQAKLRMLEVYSKDPTITAAEMGRICKLDDHTVAKFKKQLFEQIAAIKLNVEKTEKETEEATVGIWQKLINMIPGSSTSKPPEPPQIL